MKLAGDTTYAIDDDALSGHVTHPAGVPLG